MNIAFIQYHNGNREIQLAHKKEIKNKVKHHNDYSIDDFIDARELVNFKDIISFCKEEALTEDIQSLYIYNRSEIASDIKSLYDFALLCQSENIKLYAVTEKRELTGQIIKDFNAGKDKWVEDRSADSYEQMKQQASEGKWMASAPLGYVLKGKTLFIDEETVNAIKEIFLHYSRGLTAETCTRFLYEVHNIGTAIGQKSERAMSTPKFYEILTQPLYNGFPAWNRSNFVKQNGKKKRVFLPRKDWIIAEKQLDNLKIVDDETYEKVVKRLKKEGKYELCDPSLLEEDIEVIN